MKLLQSLLIVAIFAAFWAFVLDAVDKDMARKEALVRKYGHVTVN